MVWYYSGPPESRWEAKKEKKKEKTHCGIGIRIGRW